MDGGRLGVVKGSRPLGWGVQKKIEADRRRKKQRALKNLKRFKKTRRRVQDHRCAKRDQGREVRFYRSKVEENENDQYEGHITAEPA